MPFSPFCCSALSINFEYMLFSIYPSNYTMPSYLDFQKGFKTLTAHVKAWKDALLKDLQEGKLISSADEAWLDTEANLIDKHLVLDHLRGSTNINEDIRSLPEALQHAGECLAAASSPSGVYTSFNYH